MSGPGAFQAVGRILRRSVQDHPARSVTVAVAVILAGQAEAIGLLSLLPLLVRLGEGGDEPPSAITEVIDAALLSVGLPPTVPVLLSLIVLALTVKALLMLLAMRHLGYVAAAITTDLRIRLLRALLAARWSHFVDQPIGQLGNAIGTEATRASAGCTSSWQFAAALIQLLIFLIAALAVSWWLTAGAMAAGLLLFVVLGAAIRMAHRSGRRQTALLASLTGRLVDVLQGIKPMKAMGVERNVAPLLERDTNELNGALRQQVLATAAIGLVPEPLMALLMAIGLMIALSIAPIPVEELLVLAALFIRSIGRVTQAQKHMQATLANESAFWAIDQSIAEAEAAAEPSHANGPTVLREAIRFEDVRFSYGETAILKGLDLTIPAKGLVALVGPSGAGKTTLGDLLCALHQPSAGRVLADGVDLATTEPSAWRRHIGYVPQEPILFHASIRENITLGDRFNDNRIQDALEQSGARAFIDELPSGLDTVIGERGMKLSGGQRQRLAIARALLRDPLVLVLDEATTALDPETEASICENLSRIARRKAILAISHQTAIVDVADAVYAMEDGRATRTR